MSAFVVSWRVLFLCSKYWQNAFISQTVRSYGSLLFTIHETADMGKTFPKGAHVKLDRTGPVRLPQLADPLADKHERQPPPVIALKVIERAADAVKEGG